MIRLASFLQAPGRWRMALLLLASGAAASLALPPIGMWPLSFVSFPVLLCMLEGLERGQFRRAFFMGWLFGLGYFGSALHWIAYAFLVEAETYLWMMPFMVGALAGGMAVYWGLSAALANALRLRGLGLVAGFAALLSLAELLRGHLFTGFPWAAPGQIADSMGSVAQFASIAGMTGLTFLAVLWAGLPALLLQRPGRLQTILACAAGMGLPVIWWWGHARLASDEATYVPGVEIRIVQPDIGQDAKWRKENSRAIFDDLKALSMAPSEDRPEGIAGVTHLIWPESAVPFLIDQSPAARDELKPVLGGKTVLITGSIRRQAGNGENSYFNSVIVFDGDMNPIQRYDKWRLVPGGEFLPFAWLLEPLGFRKVVTVPGDFAAGPGARTLELPDAPPAGFLVCYEAIFPDRLVDPANRPQWIVNVTNDGWFGTSTGPYQHLAQARLRAIEQGIPIVRAANTGISAVIDPYGRILQQLPLGTRGVLDTGLPRPATATIYSRFGDWLAAVLAIAILGCCLPYRIAKRKIFG